MFQSVHEHRVLLGTSGSRRLKRGPGRDLAVLEVAPQCDGQAPRQRHDADPSHALAPARKALPKPPGQEALGLQGQPAPGQFDQHRARSLGARLADALLDLTASTIVGRRREPQTADQLAPVGETSPAKHFPDQHPGPLVSDRAQSCQLRDQRMLAFGQLLAPRPAP